MLQLLYLYLTATVVLLNGFEKAKRIQHASLTYGMLQGPLSKKEKGYELVKEWIKGVRNHLYWCTTSSTQGFQEMIIAKWRSFMRHVCNKRKDHVHSLFKECAHDDDIEPRKWMKIGKYIFVI